jgi:1-acyl-sn-glycerol-3-phosphate acyltransferase
LCAAAACFGASSAAWRNIYCAACAEDYQNRFALKCCIAGRAGLFRAWPAVGWIATLAGTIYVDRSRRSETHTIQPEIQSALAHGLRLFLFPEGTSSDGSRVLPFHSSLFQPAVDLRVPVSAASIEYAITGGVAASEACYFGTMKLFPHLINLLGKHSVIARVNFSSNSFLFTERKQASLKMHEEVERLRFSSVEVAP